MTTIESPIRTIEELKATCATNFITLKKELSKSRVFLIGQQVEKTRLPKSLAAVDRRDLASSTLLTKEVRDLHSGKLCAQYMKKWNRVRTQHLKDWSNLPGEMRIGTKLPKDFDIAATHMRFFTLIDSVAVVNSDAAMYAANVMRNELQAVLKNSKGIWCRGVIEIEVISLTMQRRIRELNKNTDSELRKSDVCEELAKDLQGTLYQDETSLFLIHFHGILCAKNSDEFERFRKRLKSVDRWTKTPRQIEIKHLSEEYMGKPKTVELNLKHIARYITKGGNDWDGKTISFRYKVSFDKQDDSGEDAFFAKYWRSDEALRAEHKHVGINDPLSMTAYEIGQLAITIDRLMAYGGSKDRTGYLISSGQSR